MADGPFDEGHLPERYNEKKVIYLEEQGCFGILVSENYYYSIVAYYKDGTYYEIYIDNEELDEDSL